MEVLILRELRTRFRASADGAEFSWRRHFRRGISEVKVAEAKVAADSSRPKRQTFGAARPRNIFLEVFILRGFKPFKTEVLILRELQMRFCASADNAELGCSRACCGAWATKKASGPAKSAAP
jgi:hypothetical protein